MRPRAWIGSLAAALASAPLAASAQEDASHPEVRFIADAPEVTLYRYGGPFAPDTPICRAPCGRVLDPGTGKQFYFGGDDLVRSERFSLEGRKAEVRLRVHAGKGRSARYGAIAAFPIGGAAMGGGFAMMLLGLIWGPNVESSNRGSNGFLIAGGLMAGTGALLITAGVVGILKTPPTRFEFARLRPSPGGLAFTF